MESLEVRIKDALKHHVERSPIEGQAPPIDELLAGRARHVSIASARHVPARRLLTAAAVLVVAAAAGLAIFVSRSTTSGRTEPSSPRPDTYAAVLAPHDAHLIDTNTEVGASGPRRNLTVYAPQDPARAIVVSDGPTSSHSSLDYYTSNNTFGPDASAPFEVNGTTVALAKPSGDTGGLWLALWTHGTSTTQVAGRNTTRAEVIAIIRVLTASPSGTSVDRALPKGFRKLYDGPDNNPFLGIRPSGTIATYQTPSSGRFALFYQRVGTADPRSLVWALPHAKVRTIDGHQAIVNEAKPTTTVYELNGPTMTALSVPAEEAAVLLPKVRYVDHASWIAHTRTASQPGTVYQTAATTTPASSPVTTAAQSKGCLPEPLRLSERRVPLGKTVEVTAGGSTCPLYPVGKQYRLKLAFLGRSEPVDLGSYPVDRDGRFAATIRVPRSASPGDAFLSVSGSPYDKPCVDTHNSSGSCATYSVALTLTPPP